MMATMVGRSGTKLWKSFSPRTVSRLTGTRFRIRVAYINRIHDHIIISSQNRSSFLSHSPLILSPTMSSLSDHHSTKTVKVVVKGRVQGVFYRNWTVENAKELGLRGWVRNRRDGSVEALFSGSADKVEEMEQRCRRGPPAATVTGFEVSPCSDDPGSGFERRQTV